MKSFPNAFPPFRRSPRLCCSASDVRTSSVEFWFSQNFRRLFNCQQLRARSWKTFPFTVVRVSKVWRDKLFSSFRSFSSKPGEFSRFCRSILSLTLLRSLWKKIFASSFVLSISLFKVHCFWFVLETLFYCFVQVKRGKETIQEFVLTFVWTNCPWHGLCFFLICSFVNRNILWVPGRYKTILEIRELMDKARAKSNFWCKLFHQKIG